MFEPITYKTVISVIKRYETDGHSPYLVLTEDYEQFVLKVPNNINDIYSLQKEFLCSSILKCWQLVSPVTSALTLSKDLVDSPFVIGDKRFYNSQQYFGSQFQSDSIDLQSFISVKDKVGIRKLLNPQDLLTIALFDIWIENDDRKPTNNNLLLCSTKNGLLITPIDHAHTFASLCFDQLNPKFLSFSDNDSIIYSPIGQSIAGSTEITADWLASAKEKFYLCVKTTKASFPQICSSLPKELALTSEEISKLYDFLFNKERNKNVFDQFSYIISSIN